jgi:hypothetical protein
MDELAFRQRLSGLTRLPCPFARAILGSCATCREAERVHIAEREVVTCRAPGSHTRCRALYEQLRRSFSFALGRVQFDKEAPLPHAQEMRVQCGGLKGLQQTLDGTTEIANIDQSLANAIARWGAVEDIPYSEVVHAATLSYKGRRA